MEILQKINNIRSRIVQNVATNGLKLSAAAILSKKSLWGYVDIAFNRLDTDRQLKVGPDRLCGEWVIRNGGTITTVDKPNRRLHNYNTLPPENNHFKIKMIDASSSTIMKIGLEHLKGCNSIDTVILDQCKNLESDGLDGLVHLKDTLKDLHVSACDNISDDGLIVIAELSNLELLKLSKMRYVRDWAKVTEYLKTKLPNCHMELT